MLADMMAGTRGTVYGCSEMAAFLHEEGIPLETIESLLTSTPSPTCLGGPQPVTVNLKSVHGSTTPDRPCLLASHPAYNTPPAASSVMMAMNDSDLDDCGLFVQQYPQQPNPTDPKKRRLTSEQVQLLERSFEAESKLEPERKAKIALSLGLQPRQVAIWFQNRRARWKTKQLERDYEVVRAAYEAMKREYEAARKEKEKLEAEVNYLREEVVKRQKKRRWNSTGSEVPDDETQPQKPGWTTSEKKMMIGSENEALALRKQGVMLTLLQPEEPTETDQSELSHAEEEDLDGVAAAAAAYCFGFPTGVVEHPPQPLWLWHPGEFCGL